MLIFISNLKNNLYNKLKSTPKVRFLMLTIIIGVSAFAYPVSHSLERSGTCPKLVIPGEPTVIGKGRPGAKVMGYFAIKNRGTANLKFTLRPSCGCSDMSPRDGVIEPGGEAKVRIAITLGPGDGFDKNVRVLIDSNDPTRPETSCEVIARCPKVLSIEPRRLDFGQVRLTGNSTRSLVVSATDEGLKAGIKLGRLKIATSSQALQTRSAENDDDGSVRIDVTLKAASLDSTGGIAEEQIDLDVDEERFTVPVTANLVDDYTVFPRNLIMVSGKSHYLILIRENGLSLGTLVSATAPSEITTREVGRHGLFREIELIVPSQQVGSEGRVQLHFTNSTRPIELWVKSLESF